MTTPHTKEQPPLAAGIHIDTTIATMEKATLSTTITSCPSPFDRSPCPSGNSSPRSERSANPFDTDVEAMMTHGSTDKCPRSSIVLNRKNDCQVWPGKDHWKQRAKAAKRQRSCACLARLNRRSRIAVKILIVLLVVGIAVGVGFGVSKPLGAPIWGKNNS